jgi:hypothetical protein
LKLHLEEEVMWEIFESKGYVGDAPVRARELAQKLRGL